MADTDQAREDYYIHYLASTLTKAQLQTVTHGMDNVDFALKIPLANLPPGVPSAFQDAVAMRVFPNDSKRGLPDVCIAPWRGIGGLLVRDDNTMRVNMDPATHRTEGELVAAELFVGSSLEAPVKADIILRKG